LSVKGIGLGLLAAFVLAIPLDLLFGYYLSAVYDELAPGVNFANQAEADAFAARVMGHPLMIAFAILATLLTVGLPGYIAALVANRAFVLHSTVVGAILSSFAFLEWDFAAQFPYLFSSLIGFGMLVAVAAGDTRKRQVGARGG